MNPQETSPPSGVLVINKAPGMTSHDVVAIARRQLNIKKIGHCGTLDPMATGVLMLVINKATKLQDLLMSDRKQYEGTLTLGVTTSSQDKEGEILTKEEVPDFSETQIKEAFAAYDGDFEQIPPMVSAIKKDGVPLYKLARKGIEIKRDPRPVTIFKHEVTRFEATEVDFIVDCSKGFYVRTYAHDIGQDLGCGAHLSRLKRSRSGDFDLSRAVNAEDLKTTSREDLLAAMITLPEIAKMRGV